ncbi:hypothetical protein KDW_38580 [Dictyobacter vulcani]|uniref:Uncharacterized protein n=1 Tax=Dictyobacter vulcani TaxID=2607529 RepID=A0A5J4KWW4_9CHLR|nr:hypothetical protein [Dictyobacter vulcani]GER89696.1 hypothetical protein KDW_38580 [Dictyobacter vulcani]
MFAPAISQRSTPSFTPLLIGTVPVRPFSPDGFVGTIEQDGQVVNVTAIAFDAGQVVLMSLVGRDTSVSAVLAQIWKKKEAVFRHAETVPWPQEEQSFTRLETERYKEIATRLPGLKLVHALTIPLSAHIAQGILQAPPMDKHPQRQKQSIPVVTPRYVLGNLQEETPHALSFLGHLRAMRVVLLYRDDTHPERIQLWASALWHRGLKHQLIEAMPALGVRVWKIHPDVHQWNTLIAQGVHEGWLPWSRD